MSKLVFAMKMTQSDILCNLYMTSDLHFPEAINVKVKEVNVYETSSPFGGVTYDTFTRCPGTSDWLVRMDQVYHGI